MQSMMFLAAVFGLAAGALLAVQPGANGELGRSLAHPLQASIISFGSGFALLLVVTIALGHFPPRLLTPAREIPWWAWMGGAIGTVLVTTSLIFAPRTGALIWIGLVLTGQIVASLILDHFGLVGYPAKPVTTMRLLGALLLVLGIFVVLRG